MEFTAGGEFTAAGVLDAAADECVVAGLLAFHLLSVVRPAWLIGTSIAQCRTDAQASAVRSPMAWIDTLAAGFSAVAAGGAWLTAERARKTADTVAVIERDRWHEELTPRLALRIGGGLDLRLTVRFDGPTGLRRLDEVRVTIRDDRDRSEDPLFGRITAEDRAKVIWGPARFRHGADEADQLGRSVAPFKLDLGEQRPLAMEQSLAPPWYEGADGAARWRRDYDDANVRLWITCIAKGHKPWLLTQDVPIHRAEDYPPAQ
ncbi:hypothetical protein K7472_31255 [Streptomyces sp. PTM05]|uniref:Uncharacterized protein n=1 Tax=Streptantibioticus parmotrematis TaxID=2873249 RepID=A0ABS7R1E7_9ACTN|nr:hypothetical protein [Streptantibioticus parmotrematis]MBY8889287.1 hypothetical protein [Streptantibioticus parmotrematis]